MNTSRYRIAASLLFSVCTLLCCSAQKDTLSLYNQLNSLKYKEINVEQTARMMEGIFRESNAIQYLNGSGLSGNYLANYYNGTGDYDQALKYGLAAEKAFAKNDNLLGLAKTYNLLGNTYMGLNDTTQMKRYFRLCYDIAIAGQFQIEAGYGAGGIANYYSTTGNYDLAIYWNKQAAKGFLAGGKTMAYSICLTNISDCYREKKNIGLALQYAREAEKLLPEVKLPYARFLIHHALGLALVGTKPEEAANELKQAYDLAEEDNAKHNLSEVAKSLSDLYYGMGKYKLAADYLRTYSQFHEAVFNEKSSQQLLETQEKYESEKKSTAIKLLNQRDRINQSSLQRKQLLIWGGFAVLVLLVVLIVFVVRSNFSKNTANRKLQQQKRIIEEKQQEILDSITYAKRIQGTFLATEKMLGRISAEHLVFFKPKDIVSGDFYWATETEDSWYLAVCDSTGHGVPGAFMSLLNTGFLSEAINDKHMYAPHEILNFVRKRLAESVSRDGQKDGFDGVVARFYKNSAQLDYAASYNAPILISGDEAVELPKDRMPVGLSDHENSFTLHSVTLRNGDMLYFATDGFADQFGGEKGKKYKSGNLVRFLKSIRNIPCRDQELLLENEFQSWKGALEQVDDICIVGIQVISEIS